MLTGQLGDLVLPYFEANEASFSLNKLLFVDEQDSMRYVIQLDDRKAVQSVGIVTSASQEERSDLVSYIQNPIPDSTPLLLRIDPQFCKIKMAVSISPSESTDKSIIIVKSLSGNDNIDNILQQLIHNDNPDTDSTSDRRIEISKLEYRSLPIDHARVDSQRIVINDSFQPGLFENKNLNVFVWEFNNGTKEYSFLFKFGVWIDSEKKSVSSSEVVKPINQEDPLFETQEPIPEAQEKDLGLIQEEIKTKEHEHLQTFKIADYKREFNFSIEDGPIFRSSLAKYESDIPVYKKVCSNLLEEMKRLDSIVKRLSATKIKIIELFNAFSDLQFNSILKRSGFPQNFEKTFKSIVDPLERNMKFFLRDVCDVKLIQRINTNLSSDITEQNSTSSNTNHNGNEPSKKKSFESNSKEYYSWLNKYLSNEKDRPQSKLLAKRKSFDLAKFDYLNYLNSITNNQYVNQLLESLFKFTTVDYDSSNPRLLDVANFKDIKKSQGLLNDNYSIYLNVLLRFNSEKYQFRQMIEACHSNDELTRVIRYNKLNYNFTGAEANLDITKENLDLVFSNNFILSRKPDATDHAIDDQISDMSGILYALGGQGKQGWHKEWVVLRKGQLSEYSNWRKGTSPVNKPIEVALSNIKSINYDKRQFCFEIFTSSANKHVFQAISEYDRNMWIKALYNAGQVVNIRRLKEKHAKPETYHPDQHIKGSIKTTSESVNTGKSLERAISPVSIKSTSSRAKDFLQLVRSIPHTDNSICVDCGSHESVEWISINFLVCFCVKCASGHRSLGSHITKIRSLKLDKFQNEGELLLEYVNNRQANIYLEAKLTDIKPTNTSSPEERLKFITNKYVQRKYRLSIPEPNNQMIRAVQKINIPEILKCVYCDADLNITVEAMLPNRVESKVVSLFEYSLRKYVEREGHKYFVIPELLLLNGCKFDKELSKDIGLTEEAIEYWNRRSLNLGRV